MRPGRVYRWFTLGKNHNSEMCKERDVELLLISDERILSKEDPKPIVLVGLLLHA
jgi:hypothetical protein